jgi:hypothetical protein
VGEYTVCADDTGKMQVQRHGLHWRDCTGDGLINSLAHEIEALREVVAHDTKRMQAMAAKLSSAGFDCS